MPAEKKKEKKDKKISFFISLQVMGLLCLDYEQQSHFGT